MGCWKTFLNIVTGKYKKNRRSEMNCEIVVAPEGARGPPANGGIAATHDPNYQTLAGMGQECLGADKAPAAGGGGAAAPAAGADGPKPPATGGIAGTHDPNYQTLAGMGQECLGDDIPPSTATDKPAGIERLAKAAARNRDRLGIKDEDANIESKRVTLEKTTIVQEPQPTASKSTAATSSKSSHNKKPQTYRPVQVLTLGIGGDDLAPGVVRETQATKEKDSDSKIRDDKTSSELSDDNSDESTKTTSEKSDATQESGFGKVPAVSQTTQSLTLDDAPHLKSSTDPKKRETSRAKKRMPQAQNEEDPFEGEDAGGEQEDVQAPFQLRKPLPSAANLKPVMMHTKAMKKSTKRKRRTSRTRTQSIHQPVVEPEPKEAPTPPSSTPPINRPPKTAVAPPPLAPAETQDSEEGDDEKPEEKATPKRTPAPGELNDKSGSDEKQTTSPPTVSTANKVPKPKAEDPKEEL